MTTTGPSSSPRRRAAPGDRTSRSTQTGRWSEAATRSAGSRSTGRCASTSSEPLAKITSSRWRGWRAVNVGVVLADRPQPPGDRGPGPAVLPLVEVSRDDQRAVGRQRPQHVAGVPGPLVRIQAEVHADDVEQRAPRQRHRRHGVAPLALPPPDPQPLVAGAPDVDPQRGEDRRPAAAAVRRRTTSAPHRRANSATRWPENGWRGTSCRQSTSGSIARTTRRGRVDVVLEVTHVVRRDPQDAVHLSRAARRSRRRGPGRPHRSARRRCPARRRRCGPRDGSRGR